MKTTSRKHERKRRGVDADEEMIGVQCVAVCCSVLQCVAVCYSVL